CHIIPTALNTARRQEVMNLTTTTIKESIIIRGGYSRHLQLNNTDNIANFT
ncbi:hypothetical protein Pmar_PMAR012450, partial [Perkinsus marinus ATCC 50983]